MKRTLLLLIVFLSAACACDKSQKSLVSIISGDLLEAPSSGVEGYEISFHCNGDWTVQETQPWITVTSAASGSGDGSVTIDVAPNTEKAERSAFVSILCGSVKASLFVRQASFSDVKFKHPSIAFTAEQFKKITDAYSKASSTSSIKKAVDYVFTQANGNYDVNSLTLSQYKESKSGGTIYNTALAPALRSMNCSFAYMITTDSAKKDTYAKKAVNILATWAQNCAGIVYDTGHVDEAQGIQDGGTGMYIARCMWPFFVTYDIFKGSSYITEDQDKAIVAWFRAMEKAIKGCVNLWERYDYLGKQEWNNWVCAHSWGLLSIGYAIEDSSLIQYAMESQQNPRDFKELITGCIFMEGDTPCVRDKAGIGTVEKGELYDRFRHHTAPLKGLQYTSLELQILSSMARTCYNNGVDMYAYTAPTGENISLAYDYYSDYYATLRDDLHNGYYTGEASRIAKAGDMQGLFELGYNAYPAGKSKTVIDAIKDRGGQVHSALGALRLYSIDVDPTR